jgi:hypothetical protein
MECIAVLETYSRSCRKRKVNKDGQNDIIRRLVIFTLHFGEEEDKWPGHVASMGIRMHVQF